MSGMVEDPRSGNEEVVTHLLGKLRLVSMSPQRLFRHSGEMLCHVVTVNAELFVLAHENPEYGEVLASAVNVIDGRVVQWIAALLNPGSWPKKLSGSNLIYSIAAHCRDVGSQLFLLGGTPRANRLACSRLRELYPGLIVGGHSPPMTDDVADAKWNQDVLDRVTSAGPGFLAVCLGSPKQELWIAMNRESLAAAGVRFVIGLGGTVDFVAGVVRRAPRMIQWIGLEWFFRFLQFPRERFKRTVTMLRLPYHAIRSLSAGRRLRT